VTKAIITAFVLHAHDPGNSGNKIGVNKPLRDMSDAELYAYMEPWHRTLPCQGFVLHDGLPQSFLDRWHSELCQLVRIDASGGEMAWIKRYRMLQRFLEIRVDLERVFFTDINDVAFLESPFDWFDRWGVNRQQLLIGDELLLFGKNPWFSGEAIKQFPPEVNRWFHANPDTAPLSAGCWGGPYDLVLPLVQHMTRAFDRHRWLIDHFPNVSWDMIFFNYLAYTTSECLATFKMIPHKVPSSFTGLTLRQNNIANPLVHDTHESRRGL
jgi:hypothetical protein